MMQQWDLNGNLEIKNDLPELLTLGNSNDNKAVQTSNPSRGASGFLTGTIDWMIANYLRRKLTNKIFMLALERYSTVICTIDAQIYSCAPPARCLANGGTRLWQSKYSLAPR
ncbi:16285_t:CDS:2 [Acaulospora colombiana]|uniref:16285_t:CDS:1 n=1 Tax=Acaulospora colombiana TaxID=27376 RepID=A0ACA9JXF8_9GLOM|nr:16285_t:CDS:2 [Acaulospora colombiana]